YSAPVLEQEPSAAPFQSAVEPPQGVPRSAHPIRPPLAGMPGSRPAAGPEGGAYSRPVPSPAKPLPTAPRPGQILSGPRQPFPGGMEGVRAPGTPVISRTPAAPQRPVSRPTSSQTPPASMIAPGPATARPQTRPGLAGQPAARPVVPP